METADETDLAPTASQLYEIETSKTPSTRAKSFQEYFDAVMIGVELEPPIYEKAKDILKRLNKSSLLELCEEYCFGEFHLVEECKEQHCLIAKEIFQLIADLRTKCSEIDPRFESNLVLTGSSAEGTKMWLPNEYDFLIELVQLRGNCEFDNTNVFSARLFVTKECHKLWSDLCFDSTYGVCPLKLRDYFYNLILKAASLLDRNNYQNIRWPEIAIEGTKVGLNITVHWCGDKYKDMQISIDLTPGIPVHLSEKQLSRFNAYSIRKLVNNCIHVIPHPRFGGIWRRSFTLSEFQIIKSLTRKQIALYKCLKFFRDMHMRCFLSKDKVPSYYLKTFFFNYLFRDNDSPGADTEDEDFYRSFCRFLNHLILASSSPNGDNVTAHFFEPYNLILGRYEMLWAKSALHLLENC